MSNINWKSFLLRLLMSFVGVVMISFGSALSQAMSMGLDPFTALNTGASELLGFSLGSYQLVVNFIILAIVFLLKRDLIGWGTVINMVLVGYLVEFFLGMFENLFPSDLSLIVSLLITVVAIAIFTFGVAMYSDADLGISPYDAVTPVIIDRTGWQYKYTRMGQDIIVVIIAFVIGGPVGISTFITGFMAGPLIDFFSNKVTDPMGEKVKKMS